MVHPSVARLPTPGLLAWPSILGALQAEAPEPKKRPRHAPLGVWLFRGVLVAHFQKRGFRVQLRGQSDAGGGRRSFWVLELEARWY